MVAGDVKFLAAVRKTAGLCPDTVSSSLPYFSITFRLITSRPFHLFFAADLGDFKFVFVEKFSRAFNVIRGTPETDVSFTCDWIM